MSTNPRRRKHFPRMKVRGQRRRREETTAALAATADAIQAALPGMIAALKTLRDAVAEAFPHRKAT